MAATVPAMRGSVTGRKPDERQQEQAGIERIGAVGLGERVLLAAEPAPAHVVMDRRADGAPAIDGTAEAELLHRLHRAIECDPGERLRVGEMAARTTHLPQPLVGVRPGPLERVEQMDLQAPGPFVRREAGLPGLVQRVHDLAIHVELQLADGGIARAHGP